MSSRKRKSRSQRRKQSAAASRDFWGHDDDLRDEPEPIAASIAPSAMVRSLGRPPLAGHDQVAEHYFEAVYDKAAMLAGALATASGLRSTEDAEDELGW